MQNLLSRAQAVILFCLLSLTGESQISYLLYMNFEKTTLEAYKTPLHEYDQAWTAALFHLSNNKYFKVCFVEQILHVVSHSFARLALRKMN